MVNKLFRSERLEDLLQAHWTEFIDPIMLMKTVMEHVSSNQFKTIVQAAIPPKQVKVTITKVDIISQNRPEFWVEFSIPKDNGVVVGTNIYHIDAAGNVVLINSFGTNFVPKQIV
jgi:hypothetical protein